MFAVLLLVFAKSQPRLCVEVSFFLIWRVFRVIVKVSWNKNEEYYKSILDCAAKKNINVLGIGYIFYLLYPKNGWSFFGLNYS